MSGRGTDDLEALIAEPCLAGGRNVRSLRLWRLRSRGHDRWGSRRCRYADHNLQVDTELGVRSSSDLFARLRSVEREISRGRALQVRLLQELMRRRSFSVRALSFCEVAAELDVSTDTARALLETATRSPERSERMRRLEGGE